MARTPPSLRVPSAGVGDAKIRYVDTAGWIDAEKHTTDKVHLNLEGNQAAAEKLAPILKGLSSQERIIGTASPAKAPHRLPSCWKLLVGSLGPGFQE